MADPKLTITQTGADEAAPTASKPNPPDIATDALGHTYTLKKPSILEQYRFVRFIGDVSDRYMSMVAPLVWIRSIDGDPIGFPNNQRELDALIQRLGDEGVEAVMVAVVKLAEGLPSVDESALKN